MSVLIVDAPPATDQALIMPIYPNLGHLIHLARRIVLQITQNLLILPTTFLLNILVPSFDYIENEVLVVDFLFFAIAVVQLFM